MKNFFYRVVDGDTVFSVSKRFSVPIGKIVKDNALQSEISSGDILFLQSSDDLAYKVSVNDDLSLISKRFGVSERKLLEYNGVSFIFYGLTLYIPKNF